MAHARSALLFLPLARGWRAAADQFGWRVTTRHLSATLTGGFCAALFVALAGCSTLRTVPVRFAKSGQVLLIPVEVNQARATFLLDTGATNTALADRFADRLGLQEKALPLDVPLETAAPYPVYGARYVPLTSFRLGPIRAKRNSGDALIVDLSHASRITQEEIDGLVGHATLGSADYVLNASKPSLKVGRTLRLADFGRVTQLKVRGYKTYLPISIEGKTYDFLLDTGSTRSYVSDQVFRMLEEIEVKHVELNSVSLNSSETRVFESFSTTVSLGEVSVPAFVFLVGDGNRIGLDLLRYGELSVSVRKRMFVFRSNDAHKVSSWS